MPEDLWGHAAELAGAQALEEVVLERALERETSAAGLTVDEEAVAREEGLLVREMRAQSGADDRAAAGALERIRRERGLGPTRYAALLRRSAMLRALVAGSAEVTPEELARERDLADGPRVTARVMRLIDPVAAASARREVMENRTDADSLSVAFARIATERSLDVSADAGGLVRGVSPLDPGIDPALREALATLVPGAVSEVLVLRDGAWLVLVEDRAPAAGSGLSDALIVERLRLRKERVAMETLAQRLVSGAGVTVLDPSLAWSRQSVR
jgi:hypothetical protein